VLHRVRDLDFNLLVVFDAIHRFGAVTRAAQHLGLTQGAVSHSLKRLRELFDDPLFVRGKEGLVLSERGAELALPVTEILERAQEMLAAQIGFDPTSATRVVSVGLHAAGELAVLPPLIRRLRVAAPHCTISSRHLRLDEAVSALETGEVDLVLSGALATPGDLLQQKLHSHSYVAMVSQQSPLPAEISLEEYCALDHVAARPHLVSRSQLEAFLGAKGLTRRILVTTDNILVLPHLIEDEPCLVMTVPDFMRDHCIRAAKVRQVRITGGLPSFDVFQVWHRRYDRDNFNQWLRGVVRSAFLNNPVYSGPDHPLAA